MADPGAEELFCSLLTLYRPTGSPLTPSAHLEKFLLSIIAILNDKYNHIEELDHMIAAFDNMSNEHIQTLIAKYRLDSSLFSANWISELIHSIVRDYKNPEKWHTQSLKILQDLSRAHLTKSAANAPETPHPLLTVQDSDSRFAKLGYSLNGALQLRRLSDGLPYQSMGSAHMKELGFEIASWAQDFMVSHYGMNEIWIGDSASSEENCGPENGKSSPGWRRLSRSGIVTIDEKTLASVTLKEMRSLAQVNIFISSNFWTAERLLVIVQGSGLVRPGIWARSVCAKESLRAGSMFDYLDLAKKYQMAAIVLNPNQNSVHLRVRSEFAPGGFYEPSEYSFPIPGHESHVQHILTVYDQFIQRCQAKDIWMVAHSRGGVSALQLLNHRLETSTQTSANEIAASTLTMDGTSSTSSSSSSTQASHLRSHLRALAFTDSVHRIQSALPGVKTWLATNARDWVASPAPLDTPIPSDDPSGYLDMGCDCFSAGHTQHEWTSPCAVQSIFSFFLGPGKETEQEQTSSSSLL